MDDVKAFLTVGPASIFGGFFPDHVEGAPDKDGSDEGKHQTYDQVVGHRVYSGALVVKASACNSPLLPSILPLRAA